MQMTFHLLREQFSFPRHSLAYLRIAHDEASKLVANRTPNGVEIIPVSFNIDRSNLLNFETTASQFPISNEYPIPSEVCNKTVYKLSGEWIIPDAIEPIPSRGSTIFNWTTSENTKSNCVEKRKTIYYIHGGAVYLINLVSFWQCSNI